MDQVKMFTSVVDREVAVPNRYDFVEGRRFRRIKRWIVRRLYKWGVLAQHMKMRYDYKEVVFNIPNICAKIRARHEHLLRCRHKPKYLLIGPEQLKVVFEDKTIFVQPGLFGDRAITPLKCSMNRPNVAFSIWDIEVILIPWMSGAVLIPDPKEM